MNVTAAEHLPEPQRAARAGADADVPEPLPEWTGDRIAAERFGSPEEIRAALLPEQVAEFDAAYSAALNTARGTLQLDELRHVIRVWRREALLTENDPVSHRKALAAAAEIQRTGKPHPGGVPWSELKAKLGL